jgi:microsomal dipeptidase-like Zn-dependent dipeptidase
VAGEVRSPNREEHAFGTLRKTQFQFNASSSGAQSGAPFRRALEKEKKMAKKSKKVELKSALAMTEIAASGTFRFTSPEGVVVTSDDLAAFNATLEKLGYKAVQMTFNLMNQGAGSFLIEADTPWCCNPRSETYWSM